MKKRKGTTRAIIFILLIFICVGIYIYLYEKTKILFNESKEIKSRIIEATAKDKELEKIRFDVKASLGNYEKIQDMFISKEFVVDFIQGLESLGKEIGVLVNTESVTNAELNPSLPDKEEMKIFLTVKGSQQNVVIFLKLLELLPYKIKIDNALLQKVDNVSLDKNGKQLKLPTNTWQLSTNVSVIKLK